MPINVIISGSRNSNATNEITWITRAEQSENIRKRHFIRASRREREYNEKEIRADPN